MNIRDFRSSINNKGVLKNNKFEVQIPIGAGHYLASYAGLDVRLLTLRCDTVTLPGLSFASADGPPKLGYGPTQKIPYNPIFDDMTLTFMVDAGSQIHKMLYGWTNSIVNYEGEGAVRTNTRSGINGAVAYEVGYKSKYQVDLTINVYRDTGAGGSPRKAMSVIAYNAFPLGIPQVNLDWSEGEMLRLSIPFSYTDFKVQYSDFVETGQPQETGVSDAFNRRVEQIIAELEGSPTPSTPSNVIINPNSPQQRVLGP